MWSIRFGTMSRRGDVMLFDELFLHATGADVSMPEHAVRDRELVFRPSEVPKRLLPRHLLSRSTCGFRPMSDVVAEHGELPAHC